MKFHIAVVLFVIIEISQAIPKKDESFVDLAGDPPNFKLYYYNKDNPSVAHESNSNSPVVFNNDNLKTMFVIHGWKTSNLEKPEKFKDEVFKGRQDVGRIVIVDWSKDSIGPYGIVASERAPVIAKRTANEIERIVKSGMTSTKDIEIAAHSLGSHIAGQTGKQLQERGVGTISVILGMDPSGPGYGKGGGLQYDNRLRKGDADKVRIIHTNSRFLGSGESTGDEDIWVNGGSVQPQCENEPLWRKDSCSHSAAWDAGALDQRGIPLYEPSDPTKGKNYKAPRKISVNILILDVSPSMQDFGRIQGLVVSSRRFVSSLPLSYHLGIVIFGGYATLSSPVVNISSESVRKSLLGALPTEKTEISSTSIGAGLQTAIQAAQSVSSGNCPDFILITDGEENARPYISEVRPQLEKACSKVHSIALGPQADSKLEQLSTDTKGRMFSVSDQNKDQNIFDSLAQSLLDSSDAQLDPDARPIKLPPKTAVVDDPTPVVYTFDKTVGKDTQFSISSPNIGRMEAELTSPEGISYGRTSSFYNLNQETREIVFQLKDVVPGDWQLKLKSPDEENDVNRRKKRSSDESKDWATIFVTTSPRNSEDAPIRLEAFLNSTTIVYPYWVKIEAVVRKGERGIVSADVVATLKSPTGNITTLKLRDDGAGADELKNDGIYSRFITYLKGAGRYEVSVIATNTGNDAKLSTTWGGAEQELVGPFERSVNVASLKAEGNFVKPRPAPVTDLKIMDVDLENQLVKLSWTATGEEADEGTATAYLLKVTNKSATENAGDPAIQFEFTDADVLDKDGLVPLPAGQIQSVTVRVPLHFWDPENLFFTVQALSESRLSGISNVADSASYFQLLANGASNVKPFFYFSLLIIFIAQYHVGMRIY